MPWPPFFYLLAIRFRYWTYIPPYRARRGNKMLTQFVHMYSVYYCVVLLASLYQWLFLDVYTSPLLNIFLFLGDRLFLTVYYGISFECLGARNKRDVVVL
jgi:hypothetical protein